MPAIATTYTHKSSRLLLAVLALGTITAQLAMAQTRDSRPRPDKAERASERKQAACLDKAQSTADMRRCQFPHIDFLETRLKQTYQELLRAADQDPGRRANLEKSQK